MTFTFFVRYNGVFSGIYDNKLVFILVYNKELIIDEQNPTFSIYETQIPHLPDDINRMINRFGGGRTRRTFKKSRKSRKSRKPKKSRKQK